MIDRIFEEYQTIKELTGKILCPLFGSKWYCFFRVPYNGFLHIYRNHYKE